MFHKAVLFILILSCFSLSSCSGSDENDEREEQREEEQEALAELKQKEADSQVKNRVKLKSAGGRLKGLLSTERLKA